MTKIITQSIPADYFTLVSNGGSINKLMYDSKIYMDTSRPIRKSVYIYLPQGFSPNEEYDVLYLLHGWTENNTYFLNEYNCEFKNLLDHLIQNRVCRPIVVVSPTWDADNEEKDLDVSCKEIRYFWQEYTQDLIPAVECFVRGVKGLNIRSSWTKRAIGGFSLGAIATWYILQYAFGIQRFYLPMSGECWIEHVGEDVASVYQNIVSLIKQSAFLEDNFEIHAATAGRDSRRKPILEQAAHFTHLQDIFKSATYSLYVKENGWHAYSSVWEYLYNILPRIYPI